MVTPLAYFDLVETFAKPGCAVCRLVLRDVDRFLTSVMYERVNKSDTHRAFRNARGLCNEHSWQLTQGKGNALGIATLYEVAVAEVIKVMREGTSEWDRTRLRNNKTERNAKALADSLLPSGPCIACELLADSEKDYIGELSRKIADPQLQEAYRASEGLCLPHFRQVLYKTRNMQHLEQFIEIQGAIWDRLRADLHEFIDKNKHERMHEAMGPEGNSWLRAIEQLSGAKGVFGPEPH